MASTIFLWALLLLLPPLSVLIAGAAATRAAGMPGCETRCGNVSVPYPFGMGPERCYWPGFNLTCDRRSSPPRLLLGDGTLQVVEDIRFDSEVTVVRQGDINLDSNGDGVLGGGLRDEGPYKLAFFNDLILTGCNVRATVKNGGVAVGGCSSFCETEDVDGSDFNGFVPSRHPTSMVCAGIACCQSAIITNFQDQRAGKVAHSGSYAVELRWLGRNRTADQRWPPRVYIAMEGWFEQTRFSYDLLGRGTPPSVAVPFLLDWEVSGNGAEPDRNTSSSECPAQVARNVCRSNHAVCNKGARGYTCGCDHGYDGNPYLPGGCQDINECELSGTRCLGTCINTEGSYECGCPSGMHYDNRTGGCVIPVTGSCNRSCGDVEVPYPFGMGPSYCYRPGFNLTCDYTTSNGEHPRLLLDDYGAFRVAEISLEDATVRVFGTGALASGTTKRGTEFSFDGVFTADRETPYSLSTRNELILTGCNVKAALEAGEGANRSIISGCSSFCSFEDTVGTTNVITSKDSKYCYGMGCCQSRISMSSRGMPNILWLQWLDTSNTLDLKSMPSYVLIAEEGWFDLTLISGIPAREEVPIVLQWEVLDSGLPKPEYLNKSNYTSCHLEVVNRICKSKNSHCNPGIRGYLCQCNNGYRGNPYIIDGCRGGHKPFKGTSVIIGVASGAALILLVLIGFFILSKFKYQRAQMLKRKFFEQNRGQLLQQLVSQRADIAEKMIITLEELEKATNNFDKSRELGGGGHGTVYKGILSDLHVVAIKKPKKVVQKEIDEFINEVAILSQINHRNVVKLYGCCLETEVPMLIYEFVSNGTLYDHLHVEVPKSLSWENRLRIAIETAKSLAYLHSTASVPIIHRDIKSVNILLDDTLTSKVADFGASRYIAVEKSGLTTMVQGTVGYLDPMYFYTGRLTEKSDVYSFGVLVIELLTRKKPFSYMSSEGDGLVVHFVSSFEEGNMLSIMDQQVMDECGEDIKEVALLAVACVKLRGEDRPTMRQVELTLENLQSAKRYDMDAVVSDKYEKNDITRKMPLPNKDGRCSKEESTRQYSMEEEFLMSARCPR